MRELMPVTAQWIDDLRAEFGAEYINRQIRRGLEDGSFSAVEAGQQIGTVTRGTIGDRHGEG